MRHVSRCLLLVMFLCATSSLSFGWGCSGHQIVALIAQNQLTANARQAVMDLLSGAPIDPTLKRFCGQTGLGPLADAATWADDFREKDPTTGSWHFWDIPLNVTAEPEPTEFCEPLCVNRAIRKQLKILQAERSSREDRIKALMYVIHFMGDMHQPLHVISNNDRGGNCVPADFFELQTKEGEHAGYFPNLHGIWDTAILERVAGIRRETHDADVKRFANMLATRYSAQIASWKIAPVDIEGWAWEGHEAARNFVYGRLPAAVTPEDPVNVSSCTDDHNIGQRMLALHERVGQPYVTAVSLTMERQLAKAGARLADVLNRAFAPKPHSGPGATANNSVTQGFPIIVKIANWQQGTVLTFNGVYFTGNYTPAPGANVSFNGPSDTEFGQVFNSMTVAGSPANGTSFTVFTIITSGSASMGFTPEGAATVSLTPNLQPYVKTVTTTGPAASLGLPQTLPSCALEACGPTTDCTTDVCECVPDKKRRIFDCCP